jgi:hypothetical protein
VCSAVCLGLQNRPADQPEHQQNQKASSIVGGAELYHTAGREPSPAFAGLKKSNHLLKELVRPPSLMVEQIRNLCVVWCVVWSRRSNGALG